MCKLNHYTGYKYIHYLGSGGKGSRKSSIILSTTITMAVSTIMEHPFTTTSDPHQCRAPRSTITTIVGSRASFVESRGDGGAVSKQCEQLLQVSHPPLSGIANKGEHDTVKVGGGDCKYECESIDVQKVEQVGQVVQLDEENVQLNGQSFPWSGGERKEWDGGGRNPVHHDTVKVGGGDCKYECESIDAQKVVKMVQAVQVVQVVQSVDEKVQLNVERKQERDGGDGGGETNEGTTTPKKQMTTNQCGDYKLECESRDAPKVVTNQKAMFIDPKKSDTETIKYLKKKLKSQKKLHAKEKKSDTKTIKYLKKKLKSQKKLLKEANALRDFPITEPIRVFRKVNGRTHQIFRECNGGVQTDWTVPADLVLIHIKEWQAWATTSRTGQE